MFFFSFCSQLLQIAKKKYIMNENEMLKCDFCNESFSDEDTLSTHVLSIHKSIIEGKKKCEFCDKTYHSKNSFYVHVKDTHLKPKNFECETCTMVFLNKALLNRHKKVGMSLGQFFPARAELGPGPARPAQCHDY